MVKAGQDVYVTNPEVPEVEGRCIKIRGNECLVQLGKRNVWMAMEYLQARQYIIFDVSTNLPVDDDIYKNVYDAVDAEEDFGYDILEMGEEPPHMEVWEVNTIGEKVRKVELV